MQDNSYCISIVIPFYNCEWNFLKECLDSITCQIESDIEVIVLDDGSLDKTTAQECKKYITKYNNIRLIESKNNQGVSVTRNIGIESSKGQFIIFIDADDFVEPFTIRALREIIMSNDKIDTIFYEYSIYNKKKKIPKFRNIQEKDCINLNKKMAERMVLSTDFNSPWATAYKRAVLNEYNIRFDENLQLGEDFKFNFEYLKKFKHGKNIKKSLYNYRVRENSVTRTFSFKKVSDTGSGYFICLEIIEKFFLKDKYRKLRKNFYMQYYKALLSHLLNGILAGASKDEIKNCFKLEWIENLLSDDHEGQNEILLLVLKSKNYLLFDILAHVKKVKDTVKKIIKEK